jgi:hypothetical protein
VVKIPASALTASMQRPDHLLCYVRYRVYLRESKMNKRDYQEVSRIDGEKRFWDNCAWIYDKVVTAAKRKLRATNK